MSAQPVWDFDGPEGSRVAPGRILFVTSFDHTLYEVSGRYLLESFRAMPGDLLVCCYEGKRPAISHPQIVLYDLETDPYVSAWDKRFRGRCEKEKSYWNKRAWQWFRKAASLRAHVLFNDAHRVADWLVWLDCDTKFLRRFPELDDTIRREGKSVYYCRGTVRQWTETGLVLYDLRDQGALEFLALFFRTYDSGEFLDFERWDDCWIFDACLKQKPGIGHDMVSPSRNTKLHVVEHSELGQYITHAKGSHLKKGVR